jgi:hypothetical protein
MSGRDMKGLDLSRRALLAIACAALALGAQAQGRPPHGGFGGRGFAHGPAAYGRTPLGYGRAPAPYGRPPHGYPPRYPPGYGFGGAPPRINSLGADWREQQDEARRGVRYGRMAPLGRVIETIRQRTPGRQLDAGIEYLGDRPVYRVRWVTVQGRRVDYLVDAATGAILAGR